jgi:hypothetical protein
MVRMVSMLWDNRKYNLIDFDELEKMSVAFSKYMKFKRQQAPTLYLITPTYKRDTQLADLTIMKNTLWLVPNLVWIVVEDSKIKTNLVRRFLNNSKLNYVHLQVETPGNQKNKPGQTNKPRGILQRNCALQWLRDNKNKLQNGVVYFADDDNRYDATLFEEVEF